MRTNFYQISYVNCPRASCPTELIQKWISNLRLLTKEILDENENVVFNMVEKKEDQNRISIHLFPTKKIHSIIGQKFPEIVGAEGDCLVFTDGKYGVRVYYRKTYKVTYLMQRKKTINGFSEPRVLEARAKEIEE